MLFPHGGWPKSLADLLDEGTVIPLSIQDDYRSQYYALAGAVENPNSLYPVKSQVFLLSPFDNLIAKRDRIKRLFGFDYKLECYLPATKRDFGYYALPILWGEELVGKLDPKADRKRKTLIIQNLIFEPDFNTFEGFLPAFADKITAFAHFSECDKVEVKKVSPEKIKTPLKNLLGSLIP